MGVLGRPLRRPLGRNMRHPLDAGGGSVGPTPAQSYNFTTGTMPSGINFSRASAGDYIDQNGNWATAPADTPRYDWTLGEPLLLIEAEARTNYLLNSESPATQVVNLPTGQYTVWCEGTGSVATAATTAVGTGFGTATAGLSNTFTITTAGTVTVTVTGTLARFQLENGSFGSSRIVTTAAAATRAADVSISPIFAAFNPVEGTILVEGAVRGYRPSGEPPLLSLDANLSGNNSLAQLRINNTGLMVNRLLSGTTSVYGTAGTVWGRNIVKRMALAYKSGDTNAATDGDLVGQVTTAFSPLSNFNTMRIGQNQSGANPYMGWVKRIDYYNTRLTDSQITNMTNEATNLRFIATKGRMPDGQDMTNLQYNSRSHHIARDTITQLYAIFPNWFYNRAGSKNENTSGGTAIITASVEYPAGVFTRINFARQPAVQLLPGENGIGVANVNIPNGAVFWVREFRIASVSTTYLRGAIQDAGDFNNGERFEYAASGLTDKTMGGTIADTDGAAPRNQAAPIALLGLTTKVAALLIGDSKNRGAVDAFGITGTPGDQGELARSIGPSFGYSNCGAYGNTLDTFNGTAGHPRQVKLAVYATHVVSEYGINDITGGASLATMQARLQTFWGFFPTKKVSHCTITPVSTSTDGWTTTANQSVVGTNSVRVAVNNWLRSTVAPLWAVHEVADVVESARDSGIWKADGVTPGLWTADGTHESKYAFEQIQASNVINPATFTV